jgi:hypothetical protein
LAQVRYLLSDGLGPLHYCDPDQYPVAIDNELEKAIEAFPTIQADTPTFEAILAYTGLTSLTEFTDDQKLQIYREWKFLNAVSVQPLADGTYAFEVTTEGDAASGQALHMVGTVDGVSGAITIASQEDVFGVSCPI